MYRPQLGEVNESCISLFEGAFDPPQPKKGRQYQWHVSRETYP